MNKFCCSLSRVHCIVFCTIRLSMLQTMSISSSPSEVVATEPSNSYLALRDAKIARNHARLQSLGLLQFSNTSKYDPTTIAPPNFSVKRKRKQITRNTEHETVPNRANESLRRSVRLRSNINIKVDNEQIIETGTNKVISTAPVSHTQPLSREDLIQKMETILDPPQTEVHSTRKVTNGTKISVRDIHLNVERLLFGISSDSYNAENDNTKDTDSNVNGDRNSGVLGKPMLQSGKAYVMEESVRCGVLYNDVSKWNSVNLSFNKYCGAQEWGNNTIYLWINFDVPSSDVVNQFSTDGRHINWYGGSKMYDQTPIIQKLVRLGIQQQQQESNSNSGAIILWCRYYNTTTKGFNPYICLGRLSLVSYDPNSHPVQFIWNLLDYEKLVKRQESTKVIK